METIVFIGRGNMGAPMARRLLEAGRPLVVHDARPAAAEALRARRATWVDSPAAVAAATRTVITIVPSSREVRLVFEGEGGSSPLSPPTPFAPVSPRRAACPRS